MRARARLRSIAAAALLAATLGTTLGGCMLQGAALDGPIAVDLRVVPTPSAVDIRADGWFADRTDVYLCPVDPPLQARSRAGSRQLVAGLRLPRLWDVRGR